MFALLMMQIFPKLNMVMEVERRGTQCSYFIAN